jgi:hypothetical protein
MKVADIISTLYKSYILKGVIKDVSKFAKENFRDIEWDKDYWLHKAGLTTYNPAKRTFGGFSLFVLGVATGSLVALALAPKKGIELRSELKDKAKDFVGRSQVSGFQQTTPSAPM